MVTKFNVDKEPDSVFVSVDPFSVLGNSAAPAFFKVFLTFLYRSGSLPLDIFWNGPSERGGT